MCICCRCCRNHDRCYNAANTGACRSSWLGPSYTRYSWAWNGTHLLCGASLIMGGLRPSLPTVLLTLSPLIYLVYLALRHLNCSYCISFLFTFQTSCYSFFFYRLILFLSECPFNLSCCTLASLSYPPLIVDIDAGILPCPFHFPSSYVPWSFVSYCRFLHTLMHSPICIISSSSYSPNSGHYISLYIATSLN